MKFYAYVALVLGAILTLATFAAGFPAIGLFFFVLTLLAIARIKSDNE